MSDESASEHIKEGSSQQASDVASDVVKSFRDSANRTQQALDEGISVASDAVKNGAVIAQDGYTKAVERSQVCACKRWNSILQYTYWHSGLHHTSQNPMWLPRSYKKSSIPVSTVLACEPVFTRPNRSADFYRHWHSPHASGSGSAI